MPVRGERRDVITRLGPLALMPAAALAVHQLRYWLAFRGHAGGQLQATGHAYLHSLVPWVVLLIAVSAGVFLRALGRGLGGHRSLPRYALSFLGLWVVCAGILVAIYAAQELLEGVVAAGHPQGLLGIFGYGGWWAIPASVAVALVLAATFHGARRMLDEVAERSRQVSVPPQRSSTGRSPRSLPLPVLEPLVSGWSSRGPPR